MSNNSMMEYKEGFISKIKNFFKNLFRNKKQKMLIYLKHLILMIQKLLQTKKKSNFLMI